MKIALIGATGLVGSKVLAEALQRGHQVTALVRTPGRLPAQAGVTPVVVDVNDAGQVAAAVAGHDAVVSAFNAPRGNPEFYAQYVGAVRAIVDGVKRSGVKRVLLVGGAGSLFVAPGVQLVDTPQFPAEYRTEAQAAREALNLIGAEKTLAWSFVSPAPILAPGQRTAQFRLGGDQVLMNGDKPGNISVEDLAVAIVDELETARHLQQRFTLAY
ncbi:NAD(P)-dependent oxidoreductase [Piscinibacter sp.]|jgi:putative NADH-flavin reductase|uniref:NAD(P)-dependent oxidoreductase n=1 Tax=Piscinibacter sp. TaxID=1903157 RepID=UPI00355A1E2D